MRRNRLLAAVPEGAQSALASLLGPPPLARTAIRAEFARIAERELVITRNGKPFAVLAFTASNRVEDSLRAIRRARFEQALRVQHQRARAAGLDRVTLKDINAEITAARRAARGKRTRRS